MAFTQYTNLDFDLVKTSIKDYLRSNSNFTDFDFEGSNLSVLIDVLAYNTYITAYNSNMVANESFLDSATLRENVVSLARNIGFVPLSRRAAKANISFITADIQNSDLKTATLKAGIVCTGNQRNSSFIFSIPEDITVGIENGEAIFSEIDIYQGTFLTKTFTVDNSQPNQKYILPNPYIDTSTIRVKVELNGTTQEYSYIDNIIGINSLSQIFLVQEISDEKYEIFFGDGIFGKKPQDGSTITITYITTDGKSGNGPSNFTFSGTIIADNTVNLSGSTGVIVTNEAASNGDNIQSTESVRYYSPRLYASQYRAVTAGDYEALLPSLFPNIESVTAYGGEELSPPQYGTVYLAVKPKNSDYLSDFTKKSILNSLKQYTIAGINVRFTDINVLYVELDTTVYYNSNLIGSVSDLETQIYSSLESYSKSSDLNKFGGRFKYSKVLGIIDATNDAITSNITRVKMRRNLGVLLAPTNYEICFENRFSASPGGYNIRTTGFKIKGVSEIVYISDKPNSDLTTGNLFLFSIENNKVIIKSNTIGTVDYITGEINIDNINVSSTLALDNIIQIEATPYSNDIIAKKSVYLKLDVGSSTVTPLKDIISSGENSSGSRFSPESSYTTESKIRN
jgi:multidrug efflux pump subunit AcrA (membrane-fusion protein)